MPALNLHALAFLHPFSVENKHVFKEFTTDNVMDYSDIGPLKIPVIATWRYQWEHLHKVLGTIEDKTNKIKGNEKYKNHYMAFYFAESTYDTYSLPDGKEHKTLAQAEGLNTKAVAVFNDAKDIDLTHEMLHSCGLRHPFSEKNWIMFEKHMTDNIMDYVRPHEKDEPIEQSKVFTWKWQWRIMNPRLNVNVKGKKQATNKGTTPQKNTSSAKKPTNKTTTAPNRNK